MQARRRAVPGGLLVAGLGRGVLDRVHGVVQQALAADDAKAVWAEQDAKVELESRADFATFVVQDGARWSAVIKVAGRRSDLWTLPAFPRARVSLAGNCTGIAWLSPQTAIEH